MKRKLCICFYTHCTNCRTNKRLLLNRYLGSTLNTYGYLSIYLSLITGKPRVNWFRITSLIKRGTVCISSACKTKRHLLVFRLVLATNLSLPDSSCSNFSRFILGINYVKLIEYQVSP
uniref:Uncharacterized protein n=1 Tax=Cacopsylla melanoneura TaxID=428564 RepID=A0A8D8ZDH6_9HEMI